MIPESSLPGKGARRYGRAQCERSRAVEPDGTGSPGPDSIPPAVDIASPGRCGSVHRRLETEGPENATNVHGPPCFRSGRTRIRPYRMGRSFTLTPERIGHTHNELTTTAKRPH